MSPFLLLFLRLFHFKSALCLRLPFFPADLPALLFHFFPLSLKSLLRFRPYTHVLQLLSRIPASSFGIVGRLSYFCFDDLTEDQFIVVLQGVFQDLITLWLRPESHFTDRQLSILDTFKNTNPERIFKEYLQTRFHCSKLHTAVHDGSVLLLPSMIQLSRNRICSSVWNQCSPSSITVNSAP